VRPAPRDENACDERGVDPRPFDVEAPRP